MPNETDQFLSDLPDDQGREPFDFQQEPHVEEPQPELEEPQPKNRRERRLTQKLEAERQSAIDLAERLSRLEQAKSVSEESDYLKGVELIYGTDSPEAIQATELLKKALTGVREDAETRAYQRFLDSQTKEAAAVAEAEEELDTVLDGLEDKYGVELTEDQESAYFQLMQKMSPKDKNGNVVGLADPDAVWEIFSERLNKPRTDSRAKELSARSMVQSGATKDSTLKDDAAERQLREWGIL